MKVSEIIDSLEFTVLIVVNRTICFLIIIPLLILVILSKWSGVLMIPTSIVGFFLDWEMRTIGKLVIGGIILYLLCIFLELIVSNVYNNLNDSYNESTRELKSLWVKKDTNEN